MPDQSHYCPFINQADPRCAEHFRLDDLEHAFAFCFGRPQQCLMYQQLKAERRAQRAVALAQEARRENDQPGINAGQADASRASYRRPTPLVSVTIHARNKNRSSSSSGVSVALGR